MRGIPDVAQINPIWHGASSHVHKATGEQIGGYMRVFPLAASPMIKFCYPRSPLSRIFMHDRRRRERPNLPL